MIYQYLDVFRIHKSSKLTQQSEAAKTITHGIVVLIVVMKKYRPTRWTQNWFLSPEITFLNDFWSRL